MKRDRLGALLVLAGCVRAARPQRHTVTPSLETVGRGEVARPATPALSEPPDLDQMVPVPSALHDASLLGLAGMGARSVLLFAERTGEEGAERYTLSLAEITGRVLAVTRTQQFDATGFPTDGQWEGLLAPSLRDDEAPVSYGAEWWNAGARGVEVDFSATAWAATFARSELVPLGGNSSAQPYDPQCGYGVVPTRSEWFVDNGLHGIVGTVLPSGCGRGFVLLEQREQRIDSPTAPRSRRRVLGSYARAAHDLMPVDVRVQRTRSASALALWRRADQAPYEVLDVTVFDASFRLRWHRAARLPAGPEEYLTGSRAIELRDDVLRVATVDDRFADGRAMALSTFDESHPPDTRMVAFGEGVSDNESGLVVCGGAAWVGGLETTDGRTALRVRRFDFATGAMDAISRWSSPSAPAGMRWEHGPFTCDDGRVTTLISAHDAADLPAPREGSNAERRMARPRAVEVVSWR